MQYFEIVIKKKNILTYVIGKKNKYPLGLIKRQEKSICELLAHFKQNVKLWNKRIHQGIIMGIKITGIKIITDVQA